MFCRNFLEEIAICRQNLQVLKMSIQWCRQTPSGIALTSPNKGWTLSLTALEDVSLNEIVELRPMVELICTATIRHLGRLPWPNFFHQSISKR
jgi:hypothetical protein